MIIDKVKKVNDYYTKEFDNYKVTYKNGIISNVPPDPDNQDYQRILEWEKTDGNTIEDAD